MGVCTSCLGRDSHREGSDEDEQSRLLFDDPHSNQYGSFGEQNPGLIQVDPQEIQKEAEALSKVQRETNNHLVEIYPLDEPKAFDAGREMRMRRYQDILAKILNPALSDSANPLSSLNASDGWASEEDVEDDAQVYGQIKVEDVGPILGGFADAETAMK